jgi:hypothetical protein
MQRASKVQASTRLTVLDLTSVTSTVAFLTAILSESNIT